ncbi:MAG: hypothetical protein RL557_818 [archaeon]|jgi:hypothetical protein
MCETYNGKVDYNCMIHQGKAGLERSMSEYAISNSYKSFTGEY